ncbi:long-chain fatty acid--CoA ligase [Phenylobacterium sp.]|uniref:long-chain fatty acid--CoA ligase n=1 Tax=Phenylobacterium sp. TaxID=1871053 RepID=UPI0027351D17|nr:long-chain fatty acid--CoA ligase [Phenylobacterium sp.]MDP3852469.1 long-chain fatty acid--CoA ligase [Phenylobacterium sp.]
MLGLMQDTPLLLSSVIDYAARYHGGVEVVSKTEAGRIERSTYAAVARRARRLAAALRALGVQPGERVASLAVNSARHLELYYGATGAGAILNTVNPRLFPEQIAYILEHAENRYVFLDPAFIALIEPFAGQIPSIRGFVLLCEREAMPESSLANLMCFEDLIDAQPDDAPWTPVGEHDGAILCYTSGTTGSPKGVLYSHRSLVLHAFCATAADGMGLSSRDSVLLVTPLFHVNAWGVPFSAAMCGAKLVLPGAALDGESLYNLLRDEACTFSLGVPTVWLGFLDFISAHGERLNLSSLALERVLVGGSAAPRALIEKFDWLLGVYVIHAWGMTETSPLATIGTPLPEHAKLERQARYDIQSRQGRAIYGVELRIIDEAGQELPADGVATGELQVRGPWVLRQYYKADEPAVDADGWFTTGDVARMLPDGFLQITDRSKDVIKSGGEWISSIDLENAAIAHPEVREAAVIGVPHPKWQERPLLLVVPRPGAAPAKADILQFLANRVARWWLPDDVIFVPDLPHTATGKLLKTALRETYRDHLSRADVKVS